MVLIADMVYSIKMSKYSYLVLLTILYGALLLGGTVSAIDLDDSTYGSITDFLYDMYGIDDNAGLTAFPVLNVPMGGRAEGMASSFAAVSDDISFIEYNPAGSSVLPRSELAFFHNNWIADTRVEGIVYAFRPERVQNLGLAAGGKWLYTPFTEYNMYGDRVSKGYYSEAVAFLNGSYNFLPDYYFFGISIGMSLKGAFRFVPDYTDDEDDHIISGSGRSQSTAMVMADFGALTRFDFLKTYYSREKNTSIALVLKNFGPPAMDDPLPSVVTTAFAYKPLRPLLLSFDFSVPINFSDPNLSEKPYWAMGISVAVTEFLNIRTGLLSKSGNARIALGSAIQMQKLAIDVNYTLDLLTQLQPLNRVSIGVRFDLGDNGRRARQDEVDTLYTAGLDAFADGQLDTAEHYWLQAQDLDPHFEPVTDALKTLREAIRLQERMDEIKEGML
ncbi:UPF0164 family protein [Breznakiellaceae bacterium SP9]